MKKGRHRRPRREKSSKVTTVPVAAGHTARRSGRWISFAMLLVAVVAAWLYWGNLHQPALPLVSTAGLDPASARLVEQSLEQARAARQSGPAWGRLGAILRSLDFRAEAQRCFEIAERLDPREPRWPYLHALLLRTQAPAQAEARLRRAAELCGNEPDAPRRRLAQWLAEAGHWDEAQRELRELLRAKPDSSPALLALAHLAQVRGASTEAVALASRCTDDPRTERGAWTLLAIAHQRLGDTNAALAASRKAESLPPDAPVTDPFEMEAQGAREDARQLRDHAQRLLGSRRLAEAEPIVQRLVREQPEFAESWLLLGRMQLLRNEPGPAEQSIRRSLALDPESVNGLFQLGMVLLAQERHGEAATAFDQATRLKPDFGPAFYNLALSLARSGRKREAMLPLREAIRHNPERIDPYLLLADLHLQLGEKALAKEWVRQAGALNPADRRLRRLKERIAR